MAILSFVPRLGFKILKGERGGERKHIVWKLINILQGPMVQTGYAFVLSFLKEEFYIRGSQRLGYPRLGYREKNKVCLGNAEALELLAF